MYSQELSYSSLSSYSVNRILEGSKDKIKAAYQDALEKRHRIEPDKLSSTIKHQKNIILFLDEILRFLNQTKRSRSSSIFNTIPDGIQQFINLAKSDFEQNIMGDLPVIETEYQFKIGTTSTSILFLLDMASGYLSQLTVLLNSGKNLDNSNQKIKDIGIDAVRELEAFTHAVSVLAVLNNTDNLENVPNKFNLISNGNVSCDDTVYNSEHESADLVTLLKELEDGTAYNAGGDLKQSWINSTKSQTVLLIQDGAALKSCLTAFPKTVSTLKTNILQYLEKMSNDLSSVSLSLKVFDHVKIYKDIDTLRESIMTDLMKYANNTITKYRLASFDHVSKINDHVETTFLSVTKNMISPLELLLNNIEKEALNMYVGVIQNIGTLDQFFKSTLFEDDCRSLGILRIPVPALELPELIRFKYTSEETWKVWPKNVDLQKFVSRMNTPTMSQVINGFFSLMKTELNHVSNEMTRLQNSVSAAVAIFQTAMNDYQKEGQVDNKFIK